MNYSALGFESRNHCVEACTINKTITAFNRIPSNIFIDSDNKFRFYHKLSFSDEYNETLTIQI